MDIELLQESTSLFGYSGLKDWEVNTGLLPMENTCKKQGRHLVGQSNVIEWLCTF
jgi:hypothetical protein